MATSWLVNGTEAAVDPDAILSDLEKLRPTKSRSVAKLIVTRGAGTRGNE